MPSNFTFFSKIFFYPKYLGSQHFKCYWLQVAITSCYCYKCYWFQVFVFITFFIEKLLSQNSGKVLLQKNNNFIIFINKLFSHKVGCILSLKYMRSMIADS